MDDKDYPYDDPAFKAAVARVLDSPEGRERLRKSEAFLKELARGLKEKARNAQ